MVCMSGAFKWKAFVLVLSSISDHAFPLSSKEQDDLAFALSCVYTLHKVFLQTPLATKS